MTVARSSLTWTSRLSICSPESRTSLTIAADRRRSMAALKSCGVGLVFEVATAWSSSSPKPSLCPAFLRKSIRPMSRSFRPAGANIASRKEGLQGVCPARIPLFAVGLELRPGSEQALLYRIHEVIGVGAVDQAVVVTDAEVG